MTDPPSPGGPAVADGSPRSGARGVGWHDVWGEVRRLADGRVSLRADPALSWLGTPTDREQRVGGTRSGYQLIMDHHAALAAREIDSTRPHSARLIGVLADIADQLVERHHRAGVLGCLTPWSFVLGDERVELLDWHLPPRLDWQAMPAALARKAQRRFPPWTGFLPPEWLTDPGGAPTPATDVCCLGAILWFALTGRPPHIGPPGKVIADIRSGQRPSAVDVIRRRFPDTPPPMPLGLLADEMLELDPSARPSMLLVAYRLRAWLAIDAGRRTAQRLIEDARERQAQAHDAHAKAEQKETAGRAALARLTDEASLAAKIPHWETLESAERLRQRAYAREADIEGMLQSALRAADCPETREALADFYMSQATRAAQRREWHNLFRLEEMVKMYGGARHEAWLADEGLLSLDTEPSGAEVVLQTYEQNDERRLVPADEAPLGRTPLPKVALDAGRHRLLIRLDGYADAIMPIVIERQKHLEFMPPGSDRPVPLTLLPERAFDRERECYVPAGWFVSGGDRRAITGFPRRRLWLDGFVIQKYPVTRAEFVEFLNDTGGTASPHRPATADRGGERNPQFELDPDSEGAWRVVAGRGDHPVSQISHHAAMAYAAWLSQRAPFHAWRLPHEQEWEKAARGVDGRSFPWGDHFDWNFTRAVLGPEGGAIGPVGSHAPYDVSPYEVHDMGGNVREWCANRYAHSPPDDESDGRVTPTDALIEPLDVACRGGAFNASGDYCRICNRFRSPPNRKFMSVGFRLVRDIDAHELPSTRSTKEETD